jgi:hypothetical protein
MGLEAEAIKKLIFVFCVVTVKKLLKVNLELNDKIGSSGHMIA